MAAYQAGNAKQKECKSPGVMITWSDKQYDN